MIPVIAVGLFPPPVVGLFGQLDSFQADSFQQDPVAPGTVRAVILANGVLRQILDSELGTGKKPVVLMNGILQERSTTEGAALVIANGKLTTQSAIDTLLI